MGSQSREARPQNDLLVLAVLAEGPAHGYAIAQEINRRTDGLLRMKEGTLYPLLHSLERQRLVRATWRESERGPARRTYHLTAKGKRALSDRTAKWQRFSRAVDAVVRGEARA
jgi:PadR family transcriptional regulator PadR